MGDGSARRIAIAAGGLLGAVALWPVLAWAFATDRAIGFQDEGLYLLAADPPSPTARWVTPFGWHTAPLFDAVGHDIARFRTLGLWLLVMVGAALGWVVSRRVVGRADDPLSRIGRACIAATTAIGAPFLASGLLRTPGYNWVNLIGLMIAVTGTVLLVEVDPDTTSLWRTRPLHFGAAVLALGAWFTVPAKPSSALIVLAAAAVFVAPHFRRRTLTVAAITAAWATVWTALGLLLGWWPTTFLDVLRSTADFPPLDRNQTVPGALRDVLRTPKVAWQYLTELRPATIALVAVATVTALVVHRRQLPQRALRLAPLTVMAVAAMGTAGPWPVLGLPNPFVRFDWYGTTNAAVLLFGGALLHLWANRTTVDRTAVRRAFAITALCTAATVAFGFGSAMGIYPQAALAVALLWCATAAVVAAVGGPRCRAASLAVVVLASAVMLVSNVVDSRHHPFEGTRLLAPIDEQTDTIRIGPHAAELRVDADTRALLDELQRTATAEGLCAGTPLIGLVWQWTSTTAYAVGAEVPEHLILTIFGYPNAADVLDVTMRDLTGPEWADAWVATTDPATIDTDAAADLRAALDRLPVANGRTFPDDYTLAFDLDGLQFWRPADVASGNCG
ncbi:MAG: hypothetical protein RL238_3193 [Actinomycetota bacterium]